MSDVPSAYKGERSSGEKTPCTKEPYEVKVIRRMGRDALQIMWPARRGQAEVAGPTEVAVCKDVVITRIQPTPKSFRVNAGDVAALQASNDVTF